MTVNGENKSCYSIADHPISIEMPGIGSGFIRNFKPFSVSPDLINEGRPVIELSCNRIIQKLSATPLEQFHRELNHYSIYADRDDLIIQMVRDRKTHLLKASPDWRTFSTDLPIADRAENHFLNSFIMIAYTLASSTLKTVKLHASVIEKDGKALLFLGKSGTGKSTHSRLWQEFVPGSTLLNDDEPVVRVHNNGVRVYGTPWSGKTPCYRNISAEVAAVVCLSQSPENKLTRLGGVSAFSPVFQSCSVLRSNKRNKDLVCDTVVQMIEKVPVYRLDCRPDREAVSLTQQLIADDQ